jgi:capsular exopolysaccharide synthesis family protein
MNNRVPDDKVELTNLLQKFRRKWYFFIISGIICLSAAWVLLKFSQEKYSVKSKLYIQSTELPLAEADEFFHHDPMEKKRTVKMADEIGMLSSLRLTELAISKLDFGISYYLEQKLSEKPLIHLPPRELYNSSPFKVEIDSSNLQIVNTDITIKFLSRDKYQVQLEAEEGKLFDFEKEYATGKVSNININKVLPVSEPFQSKYLSFKINVDPDLPLKEGAKYYFKINDPNILVEKYQKKLAIEPLSKDANILIMTSEGPVPAKEKRFLNTIMEVYLQDELQTKKEQGKKTLTYIEEQLAKVNESLAEAEQKLERFKSQHNLVDIQLVKNNYLQRLDRLESEKAELSGRLEYLKKVANDLKNKKELDNVATISTVGINDPTFNTLIGQLADLVRRKASLNYNTTTNNPALKVLNIEINKTKDQLIDQLDHMIHSTELLIKDLNERIATVDREVNVLPVNERKLIELQRDFDYYNETQKYWMDKRAEASIAHSTISTNSRVIDYAAMEGNGPVSPGKKKIFVIAFLLSVFFPTALIFISNKVSSKVETKDDLASITNIPLLGVIPHVNNHNPISIKDHPKSAISESFRTLFSNINYVDTYKNSRVILISSLIPKEGKTFCAQNLATVFAMTGKKTLLMGYDLRKPRVHENLEVSNNVGLSDYLENKAELKDILLQTPVKNLFVAPSGSVPHKPLELIISEKNKNLIQELKNKFECIIIDTPPIGLVSDAMVLKQFSDLNIFIVRRGYTSKEIVKESDVLNGDKQFPNSSIILNNVFINKHYDYYED